MTSVRVGVDGQLLKFEELVMGEPEQQSSQMIESCRPRMQPAERQQKRFGVSEGRLHVVYTRGEVFDKGKKLEDKIPE